MHWLDLIPQELRQAHEDGEVVFFCGAGVSVPARLPSFKGLVKAVLEDLLLSADACRPVSMEAMAWRAFTDSRYDEALDILEHPREGGYEPKDVREKIREILTKRPRILEKHLTLARLADLDKERGRLVTTNFDHLFEKAVKKLHRQEGSKYRPIVHVAPALPPAKPQTFRGLAYLHGKLGGSPDDRQLVLTTADFGTAYMVEGWALRFAVGLFRSYRVVFVGYRVEDPMMRYLVTALDADQESKDPYAFAPYSGENKQAEELKWKLKGIEPLLYDEADEHRELWRVLEEWAKDYRGGLTGRRQKVALLSQSPPKDENDPVVRDMAWALKDVKAARYFAELKNGRRPHPGWIALLQKEGLLGLSIGRTDKGRDVVAPLVSQWLTDDLILHDVTHALRLWIVESLDTQEALDWVLHEGGVLHAVLRLEIRFQLGNAKFEIRPAFRKIWQVLADDGYAHALSEKHQFVYLFFVPRLAPDAAFAKQVFLNYLRPLPVFKIKEGSIAHILEQASNTPRVPDRDRPADWCEIDIELVGIPEDVERFREAAEDWEGALASMADDLTTRLWEAMSWLGEFDLAAPDWDLTYSGYPSISPHEQNRHLPTWTQLIKLTQESYDALVSTGNQDAAARLVRRWLSLPYPVFRRLALYAATGGRNA